ncbi:MAG: PAS domain-containing protein [Candidatus Methylomirabilales bacterium]
MTLFKRSEALQEPLPAREGEDLYLAILSHLPSSILIVDDSLRVTFANRNFLVKSRRYDEKEVVGRRVGEIFPPAILSYTDLEEKLRQVYQTGQPFEGEMEYRAPGLPNRVYFYSLTPFKDERGSVKDVMLFMDDVTEKKRLGERVLRAERHLASLVESANDLIVSIDAKGLVMTWNSAAERILGLQAREVVGKPFGGFFSKLDQGHLQDLFARLAGGGEVQEMEAKMKKKGGGEVLISWRFSAMQDESSRVVALVGIGRDLTEKRQLELQLIQSAKMAALGEMAGGIAHEIRNPLAITSSAAQILLRKGGDPKLRKECAEKIWAAATRAATIIESLLKFARPFGVGFEPLDVNSLLEETLSLIGNQIALQGIKVERRFDPHLPKTKGNRNQLQQVFMNIILNAYRAMADGGHLTISTKPLDHTRFLEISFQDTGCGIPEEHLPRIFDPFFTTMPVGEGTGLGLSIAYSIVKHHQGSIRVESQVGKGSTFAISLPALPPEEA